MPFELWGATETPWIALPQRPSLGYALLALYALAFLYVLYRERHALRALSRNQWLAVFFLSLLGLTVSHLFPISLTFESQLPPPAMTQNPETALAPFAAIPLLLAGAVINPVGALLVGLFSGLGRALWHSHQIYDPFFFAFVALFASWSMQQIYRGTLFRALRLPPVSAALVPLLLSPLVVAAVYAYAGSVAASLVALDWAFNTAQIQTVLFVLEGLLGGVVVFLLQIGVPHWRIRPGHLTSSPFARNVRSRLLANFLFFAIGLSLALVFLVFNLSVQVATRLAVNQMAHDAMAVSQQIPTFRNQVQNLLSQYSHDPVLLAEEAEVVKGELEQVSRTAGAFYRRVIVVDASGTPVAFYPDADIDSLALTRQEQQAVVDALERGAPAITAAHRVEGRDHVLSFVVPVLGPEGESQRALIGRVPGLALTNLVAGLQGTVGEGRGFIVDEQNQVIAHPDSASLLSTWAPTERDNGAVRARVAGAGDAFEGLASETNARELVYVLQGPDHPWTVVISVPYQVVLGLAIELSWPLILALGLGMALFSGNLFYLSQSISSPLQKLVRAAQQLAAGRWDSPVPLQEEGEVGQLGHAFERMRRSLQQQFHDIRLMLEVSQDISTSIDVQEGLPIILRGALRGTGAAGARAIVLNPSARHPLTFTEGPLGEQMSPLDRKIALLARQEQELILRTPDEIRQRLGLDEQTAIPVRALLALALYAKGRFQGVLWLGYLQPQRFSTTELGLTRTLASQTSVLLENARLFATAEGQRRRLAAVLASTNDPVIVTDQTDRILLINPALARTFHLRASHVIGRSVADVISNRNLVQAVTGGEERVRNLEVPIPGGRTLYASVSTIVNNEGQVLGRVAVLHDITRLKELDEMKSEFVSTVSHDLRGPLTFMRGYVTMLPMVGDVNSKQQEYIDKIMNGMQQMSTLIEDLLDLGRIEAGVEMAQGAIDAEQLLTGIAREHAEQAATHGLQLRVETAAGLPRVSGDPALIRRALVNLVSNAIRHAPHSGTVTLRAIRDEDEVIFSVQDRGPGIPKKDQIRLFEKFYQVYEIDNNGERGSGLGLAIVKSIVERHGGRVWLSSHVGRGSTFYFSLPLKGQDG
ncbi:MAG: ATP-binding protein [Candidatus Promineifilaceae bacterium]|nr:ATP-binding protein [Candidatus Promineifilaceae bacterium]